MVKHMYHNDNIQPTQRLDIQRELVDVVLLDKRGNLEALIVRLTRLRPGSGANNGEFRHVT